MQQTIITLKYHTDAGHGWLECSRDMLDSVGIADDVSRYSYQRGDNVYLEEDCDMPLLLNALRKRDIGVTVEELYKEDSPVRNFARFTK